MESRKIQRSGTTHYVYLPASWCREHNITTNSTVFLERSSKGDLIIEPKKDEKSLPKLSFELHHTSPEVINKMIIASYINPVKEFKIELKKPLEPEQILEHKKLLGGLEFVDFEENEINCQTSLALNDPDSILNAMLKKILSIIKLIKNDSSHELVERYELEVDKSNLLIQKSIITSLMYRKSTKLRHVDLYYIGSISRLLERITDILISLDPNSKLINSCEKFIMHLQNVLNNLNLSTVTDFIKEIENKGQIEVTNLKTYKEKRIYALFGHVVEILGNWVITEQVDNS
jgi:phosphate uptake regulator